MIREHIQQAINNRLAFMAHSMLFLNLQALRLIAGSRH